MKDFREIIYTLRSQFVSFTENREGVKFRDFNTLWQFKNVSFVKPNEIYVKLNDCCGATQSRARKNFLRENNVELVF